MTLRKKKAPRRRRTLRRARRTQTFAGLVSYKSGSLTPWLMGAAALFLFWQKEAIVDTVTGVLVRNRSKTDGINPMLIEDLDAYEADPALDANGNAIPITIGSGVRTAAEQLALWWSGRDANGVVVDESKHATNAKTTDQTSHGVRSGYGNAFDFDPVPATRANYVAVANWFKARGREWGGDWTKAFPPSAKNPYGGDQRHIDVMGWEQIPT